MRKQYRKNAGFAEVLAAGWLAAAPLCAAAAPGSGSGGSGDGSGPAAVANARAESDLTVVTLKPEAEVRLGIELAPVAEKTVVRERVLGGEVILPLGGKAGGGNSIHDLFPQLAPADLVKLAGLQAQSEALFEQAKVRLEAAGIAFARAEELEKEGAASRRQLDEARAELAFAKSEYAGAKAQLDLLGAPVFDLAKGAGLWVRVPVYVGDIERLDGGARVRIGGLADRPGAETIEGERVEAPLAATGGAATVDWFYAFTKPEGTAISAGQKVGVRVPLKGAGEKARTVPWSAVVYDIHGGSWIYVEAGAHSFRRVRVRIVAVVGPDAVLDGGPPPGTEVVAVGAAELFGTEFGVGK